MEQNIKNMDYERAKSKVTRYIEKMDALYKQYLKDIEKYDNEMIDSDEFEWFNRERALAFVRTWKIIRGMTPTQRNLLYAYGASDNNYDTFVRIFNGLGNKYNNNRTLTAVLVSAKRGLRGRYEKLYGKYELHNQPDEKTYRLRKRAEACRKCRAKKKSSVNQ